MPPIEKPTSTTAGAVALSGTLCAGAMLDASGARSRALWQPPLTWSLKGSFVAPNAAKLAARALSARALERAATISDFDGAMVAPYHGYRDVRAYYEDMSAAGAGDAAGLAKLARGRAPLLAVHARDDPITAFETTLAPKIAAAAENVLLLVTKHGGHIGWPLGWRPAEKRWKFMGDVTMEFANAVAEDNWNEA